MGQIDAVPQQGGDDPLPLLQGSPESALHQILRLKLAADAIKQHPLADGFIKHHEVVGIEILVEQIGTGAIDEHQLAELLQLVLGREGETSTTGAFFSLTLRVLMTKSCSIRASPS